MEWPSAGGDVPGEVRVDGEVETFGDADVVRTSGRSGRRNGMEMESEPK